MFFKRGFLNSKKGRDALATEPTSASGSNPRSSEPVIETAHNDTNDPPARDDATGSLPPSPDESEASETPIDLHSPPVPHPHNPDKTRFIWRIWPRAPHGQHIRANSKDLPEFGKRTSNGHPIWGETLWDFYKTTRVPDAPQVITYTSGSRLAGLMRSFGELDVAAGELQWADREGDPKQVFPCDIGQLIRDYERGSRFFLPPPVLQDRIPFHLLPEKLIVHDPWNTLSVDNVRDDKDASASDKDDIVHTFKLSLSEEGKQKQVAEREAAEAADKARSEQQTWRKGIPLAKPGPLDPDAFAYYALVPPRPPRPTSISEAHLYIRREDKCGSGNHSVVYFSELELPRWVLVDDELCEACWQKALQKALQEEIEKRDEAGASSSEEGEPPEIKWTMEYDQDHRDIVVVPEPADAPSLPDSAPFAQKTKIQYTRDVPRTIVTEEYTGPVAYLYPKVSWQNPAYGPVCEHLRIDGRNPPLLARVKVCAKLSIQGDRHLAREARNYQAFPSHFFEHWNGYNLVYPLHDPTPCGALVPQFYGYYVPQGDSKPATTSDTAPLPQTAPSLPANYISPILLLENCGVPIEVDNLSDDDRDTCAAMYLLFLEGGWMQNSMAERNVVMQTGPLSEWPAFRGYDRPKYSFRLIDFGRATPYKEDHGFQKSDILGLFKRLTFGS